MSAPMPHPSDVADAYVRRRAAVHGAPRRTDPYTALRGAASATPLTIVDIAWDRPSVAAIKAVAQGVARYFSPDPSKNLRASEVGAYTLAGLTVVSVFESTAGRALAGYGAGQSDARLAEAQRLACGLPTAHLVHMAVDTDTTWSSVLPYFEGAASVLGMGRTGCYGGIRVIDGAAAWGLTRLWQTAAWSGGQVSPHATLYQNGHTALNGAADINHALAADYGQFPAPGATDMALTDADVIKVWAYDRNGADAVDMHQALRDAAARSAAAAASAAAADAAAASAITSLASVLAKLDDLEARVAALVTTGLTPAQVAQIAKAVNDDAALRMAE